MSSYKLPEIRTKIDQLDEHIQELITQRAHLAGDVARAKSTEEKTPSFYRPEREAEVLRNVMVRNKGPLPDETFTRIFREIMSSCLALQNPLKIAFLGPEGTYTQAAACKQFGHAAQNIPLQTIGEVFREVEAGTAQYGVVPVENSTEGGVNQTLDCFIKTPLKICGEIDLPVHHHLLSKVTELAKIKRIYSHQQSFAQCYKWLDSHLPSIERITVNSNAEAAQRAANESGAAAIAGQIAAEIYQLQIMASCIEDEVNNTTRFAVLGQQDVPSTGNDKTSLLLASPNKPGALYHLLEPFAENNVSMTRIESRPSRQSIWEYVFFVDVEGHIKDAPIVKSLQTLENHTSLIKHLGSYPRAIP
ncbi:prephenate dehydratase [Candidatus Parabeggiatoa sp. HSG14]|uniref:prephenate dehydratase n=1 Tax=Candidatus Parabeggiatoa sp. HSG14 TaxID=3055593 RepID=UPI0025A8D929|nr:prephenate dehydratase [Thiotrichales bacterium HSG14]